MKIQKHFLLIAFLLLSLGSFCEPVVVYKNQKQMVIGKHLLILEDKLNSLSAEEALASNNYKLSAKDIPNLGLTNSSFWIKLNIKNISNSNVMLLEVATPLVEEIEFYTINKVKIILIERLGKLYPFSSRKFNSVNYLFELNIPQNQTKTYLIKIKSEDLLMVPMTLGSTTSIWDNVAKKDLLFGIYFGIIAVMILYNLFVYFSVKDKNYIYYVTYILFVGLTQMTLSGYTFKYIWPNASWMNNYSVILFSSLGGIAAIEFFKIFLQTKNRIPSLHKGLNIFNLLFVISIVLLMINLNQISFQIVQIATAILSLYLFFCVYKLVRKGDRAAKFFMLAWSLLLFGAVLFVLKDFDIVPYNTFTLYSMQIASGIEMVLLSFALADKINILKKEKEESQAEALKALQENEDIIKRQNVILDIKVTEELEKSNTELNHTLKNLKETQSKLVDAEKMASLGQLTAGIAHEINNPINFVSSSVKPLKRDIADLLSILDKYDELSIDGNIEQKIKEVTLLKKELDIDYLKEEIGILLSGIDDGANRTAEIVRGLRNFSRMDEGDLKMADLHEGINSSLILLNSTLGRIEVVKDYGNIPSIECYAGKLNQVFMNILTNATQAINTNKDFQGKGMITIKTQEKGKNVIISIKDTGPGMPQEVKNKVFEPFFTTKDVGEGTGLGLSIAFSIIEAHKGKIEVESEKGKGTEFIITLPKIQKN